MILALAWAALGLAGLYAFVTLANLSIFRAPKDRGPASRPVSILIPARDEAANIAAVVATAQGQEGAEVEIVVCDDGSSDGTDRIVEGIAAQDPRVRLIRGGPLPSGWNGKQNACRQLADAARHPRLLFLDADVRLAPDAIRRLSGYMDRRRLDLVSGFPRQIVVTLPEKVVIPQILVLLLGYLPIFFARLFSPPGFAAGCGQLMLVDAAAYRRMGGHEPFRASMHDGIQMPRAMRAAKGRTDIVDATPLATCRMYDNWEDIWAGFTKNATEGMAKPVALPIWTVLLAGGHVLPLVMIPVALAAGAPEALRLALGATGLLLLARTVLAMVVGQPARAVLLHPVGVLVTLWIQWSALLNARRGGQATWRGRAYDVS